MKKIFLLSLLSLPLFFLAQTKQQSPKQLKEKEFEIQKKKSETENPVVLPALNEIITVGSKEYDLVKANGTLSKYKAQSRLTKPKSNPKVTYHSNNKVTTLTPCDPIGISVTASSPFPADPTVDDETYFDANGFNLQLPFTFCFYGNSYTEVNYTSNGNIQLGTTNETAFSSVGFPVTNTLMIAPFWADLDNRGIGEYLIDVFPTYAVFTWTNCGYYDSKTDKTNSFQLVITDGLNPILPTGKNVGFYYYDMQWTTGDASDGLNGFPDPSFSPAIPATVGVNAGNGIDFIQLGRFGLPGSFYDGPGGGNDGIDWLDNKKFYFDLCPATGTNIDPQPTLISCDALLVCGDDILTVTNSFLAPEIGQNVTITVSAPTLGSALSYTVVPNSGSSDLILAIDGLTATDGNHTITITGTDDGAPPLTVTQQLIVSVNETVPIASILGMQSYCLPSQVSTVLTATNISTSPNQAPLTYNWSGTGTLSSTSSDVVTVNDGVYTVTITNQFGCPAVATTTVVKGETPNYNLISVNAVSSGSVYCVGPDTARIAINFGVAANPVCGIGTGVCVSPNIISVGSGSGANSSSTFPSAYGNYYKNVRHQMLYTAAELLAAGATPGKLSSVSFQVNSLLPLNTTAVSTATTYIGTLPNYSIKMKCTSNSVLGSTFDAAGLTQVFLGNVTPTVGVNTHTFSQPYIWDGTSNIIVDICYTRTTSLASSYYTSNPVMPYTNTGAGAGNVKCVYYNNDATLACGNLTGTTTNNRPNIKFGNCSAPQLGSQFNIVVTPSVGVVIPSSNDAIKIVLPSTPDVTTCYTVTLINPIGNCTKDTFICLQTMQGTTSATIAATPSAVCIGEPVTLNATGTSMSTYTIQYNNGAGVVSSINTPVTFNTAVGGINTYTLIAQGPCSAPISISTASVMVNNKLNLAISPIPNVSKCLNTSVTLTANVASSAAEPYTYNWSPAVGTSTNSTYLTSAAVTTTYVVTVNGVCANTATAGAVVSVFASDINVLITDSAVVCATKELLLHSLTTGGHPAYSFNWTILPNLNSVSSLANLNATAPDTEGTYTIMVVASDSCGFTDFDTQLITVLPPCTIEIGNVITPNGDGVNDLFKVKNIEYHPNTVLTIFDRWGRKVYENTNYANDWKAEGLNEGTYFYVLEVPEDKVYNGFVQVLR